MPKKNEHLGSSAIIPIQNLAEATWTLLRIIQAWQEIERSEAGLDVGTEHLKSQARAKIAVLEDDTRVLSERLYLYAKNHRPGFTDGGDSRLEIVSVGSVALSAWDIEKILMKLRQQGPHYLQRKVKVSKRYSPKRKR